MSFHSILAITDWKKENSITNVSYEDEHFLGSYGENIVYDMDPLKFFNIDVDLNANVLQRKIDEIIDLFKFNYNKSNRVDYKKIDIFPRAGNFCFRTSKSILSKIMNTPFEINNDKRKWIIKAQIVGKDDINLYYDVEDMINTRSESFIKHYELLKNLLFTPIPHSYYKNVISVNNPALYCFRYIIVGDFSVKYLAEIPGIIYDDEIVDGNFFDCERIHFDLIEKNDVISPELYYYNPICWSKAKLINASHCIIGIYDKQYSKLQEIIKFKSDKFENKHLFENMWSPSAAWKFLSDFLHFVSDEIKKIPCDKRNETVLKFQSFYDNKPYVVCETITTTRSTS